MFRGTFSGFCARSRYVASPTAALVRWEWVVAGIGSWAHNWCGRDEGGSSDSSREGKLPMFEQYFIKPATSDRLRGSWIGAEIEAYLVWLVDEGFSTKCIWRRVPIAFAFGEFARAR